MGAILLGIAISLLWSWLVDDDRRRWAIKAAVLSVLLYIVMDVAKLGTSILQTFLSLIGGYHGQALWDPAVCVAVTL